MEEKEEESPRDSVGSKNESVINSMSATTKSKSILKINPYISKEVFAAMDAQNIQIEIVKTDK